eukprot:GEMP01054454.1.p1 GENE.GEMP01054454.1~~GEMP01054454.1.p1  ORF type:complete len:467 (+),score=85.65 GEMP01054454.1:37-1437(+)
MVWLWLFVAACAADDDVDCWVDGYTAELCCTQADGGNPECWSGPFSYDLCCKGGPMQLTCAVSDFQFFKVATAKWYEYQVVDNRLLLHMVLNLRHFDSVFDMCAPAALIAYLLHLEQNYFCIERYWSSILGNYAKYQQEATETEKLLPSHFANGWALDKGLQHVLDLRNHAHDASVDLVICYCREDLIWLQALRGEINPQTPEARFVEKPHMDHAEGLRKRVNLRIYHKCPPNTEEEKIEERAALIKRWAPSFRDVTVRYVFDEVRADDCSAYTAYLHDSYEELPEYTFFLHADAPEHIPEFHFLAATILAANKGLLNNDFVHLGSNYVLSDGGLGMEHNEFSRVWQSLFHSSIAPKQSDVSAYCCVQFVVSRERILIRPKSFYTAAWTYFASKASYYDLFRPIKHVRTLDTIGRTPCQLAMYMWHVIFGEQMVYPRRQEDPRVPLFMRTNNVEREYFVDNEQLAF